MKHTCIHEFDEDGKMIVPTSDTTAAELDRMYDFLRFNNKEDDEGQDGP